MKLLDRHVLRSHFGPFLFGFAVITGVLFLEVFKDFLDDFLAKGVSPLTITEVLVLSLGHTVALSIPMAVLVATLMAFGQMAADNEVTAFKAAGIPVARMILPVLIVAALVTAGMVWFNDRVLPESNHRLASLTADIGRKRPTVNIEPGRFIDEFRGYNLIIGSKDEVTDEIGDVQVYALHEGRAPDLITAPRGRLSFMDDGNTLQIDLYDGEMHSMPRAEALHEEIYRITRFTEHTVLIDNVGSRLQRTEREYRGDREMRIAMMRDDIAQKERQRRDIAARFGKESRAVAQKKLDLLDPEKRAQWFRAHRAPERYSTGTEDRQRDMVHMEGASMRSYEQQVRQLQVEIHKKYSIPVACLVFVLLGAPLAIRSGRGGMTSAITFSILCFFVYYLFLTGGEKMADREILSPIVAMWSANVVFAALGGVLLWRASIDSTPIAWERLDPRHAWALRRARRRAAAEGGA